MRCDSIRLSRGLAYQWVVSDGRATPYQIMKSNRNRNGETVISKGMVWYHTNFLLVPHLTERASNKRSDPIDESKRLVLDRWIGRALVFGHFGSIRIDSMRGKVFQISDKLPMACSFWGATEYYYNYCCYYYYWQESIDAGALAKTARLGCVVPWRWQLWPSLLKTTAIHPFSRSVTLTHTHTFIVSIPFDLIRFELSFFLSTGDPTTSSSTRRRRRRWRTKCRKQHPSVLHGRFSRTSDRTHDRPHRIPFLCGIRCRPPHYWKIPFVNNYCSKSANQQTNTDGLELMPTKIQSNGLNRVGIETRTEQPRDTKKDTTKK
jgi:hypothetical protein